jgi:hypothetical protein
VWPELRYSRVGGNPEKSVPLQLTIWTPACAGVTTSPLAKSDSCKIIFVELFRHSGAGRNPDLTHFPMTAFPTTDSGTTQRILCKKLKTHNYK